MKRYSTILTNNKGKRFYKNIFYPEIPIDENDIYIIVDSWTRLETLAEDFYGNSSYYWIIAAANPNQVNMDSLYLNKGNQIRIPQDIQPIIESFNLLNNI